MYPCVYGEIRLDCKRLVTFSRCERQSRGVCHLTCPVRLVFYTNDLSHALYLNGSKWYFQIDCSFVLTICHVYYIYMGLMVCPERLFLCTNENVTCIRSKLVWIVSSETVPFCMTRSTRSKLAGKSMYNVCSLSLVQTLNSPVNMTWMISSTCSVTSGRIMR